MWRTLETNTQPCQCQQEHWSRPRQQVCSEGGTGFIQSLLISASPSPNQPRSGAGLTVNCMSATRDPWEDKSSGCFLLTCIEAHSYYNFKCTHWLFLDATEKESILQTTNFYNAATSTDFAVNQLVTSCELLKTAGRHDLKASLVVFL